MLLIALLLDGAIGDPDRIWRRVPHPAVLMGRMIAALDRWLNSDADPDELRRMKGALALALLMLPWAAGGAFLAAAPLGPVWEIIGAAALLAHRSLVDHVRAVADGLREGLDEGRDAVAKIVGRDPQALDEIGVSRAAIESAAENFSDGVVAPAFWFLLAGLPGIAVYKALNTADSMIGHRTPRHEAFGWAAARLDDFANWIPARIAAVLLFVAGLRWSGWDRLRRDAGCTARQRRLAGGGDGPGARRVALGSALLWRPAHRRALRQRRGARAGRGGHRGRDRDALARLGAAARAGLPAARRLTTQLFRSAEISSSLLMSERPSMPISFARS